MIIDLAELVAELKALRKGRGLDAPDIESHVGPVLRAVFGVEDADNSARLREKLTDRLKALAELLPTDLAQAVSMAYGLTDGSRTRLYGKRVELLAQQIDRDVRTASRRIDDGLRVIAEIAIADLRHTPPEEPPPSTPWRTTALRTSVVLDREVAEVYEMRRIAASISGLDEVTLELSIPAPPNWNKASTPDDPGIVVLHGGTLQTRLNYSSSRVVFALKLARPLELGEEHDFFVRIRFSGERRMGPFYMCTPSFPCALFDLHVRFRRDRLPRSIWKVNGLRMNEVSDRAAPRELVEADAAGEVTMEFRNLTPNLSFGIAWDE
jgi:hypothetical protein